MTQSKDDTITINLSGCTMDTDSSFIASSTFDISNTVDTIDISDITYSTIDSTIDTITIDTEHWSDSITWEQTEFEDTMPSVAKVEDMCKDYPALDKAYENFKTIYAMVHQDWKGNQDNEETPF